MELRLLTILMRVLDPRLWRRRLAQVGASLAAVIWIWVRAVRAIDGVRQRRDERHGARDLRITAANRADERRRIEESLDSLT